MAFKAYSSEAQSVLLRTLTILERAVDWSRHEKGLDTRGSFLYPACQPSMAGVTITPASRIIQYPELADLCHQEDLPLLPIETSLQAFPASWSEIGSIIQNWISDPEWLPWSVWNNPPLFSLLLEARLEDSAWYDLHPNGMLR